MQVVVDALVFGVFDVCREITGVAQNTVTITVFIIVSVEMQTIHFSIYCQSIENCGILIVNINSWASHPKALRLRSMGDGRWARE